MIETKNIPILDSIADRVIAYGFGTPCIFFLEMSKHLSFVTSQMLIFMGPLATVFVSPDPYYDFTEVLQDKKNIEYLIQQIELGMRKEDS